MIKITFPDKREKDYPEGITGLEIAQSISPRLAKEVLSIEVNNETWDLTREITTDSKIKLFKWDDEEGKHAFWHSSAHLMAEVLEFFYPGVKLGIGPSIDNGYYYDIDLGEERIITEKDFPKIEQKMIEIARTKTRYIRNDTSKKGCS